MQVLGRLTIACASDTPASFLAAHMSLSCAGRLHSATADGVVIEIPNPPEGELVGSLAAVTFPVGDTMVSFESEVVAVARDGDALLRATLVLPDDLTSGNRRSAVRVPVPRGTVTAAIHGADDVAVQAIDLALTGVLIEVDANHADELHVGEIVSLRLSIGTIRIVQEAEVRRRDGRRFGLLFLSGDAPPQQMTQIMWRLQKARMPSR